MHTSVQNAKLQQALRTIETGFLQAIMDGPESLAVFVKTWSALRESLVEAKKTFTLDTETASLADTVATNVMLLSKSFVDVDDLASTCHSRLLSDYQEVLDHCSSLDRSPCLRTRSLNNSRSPSPHSRRSYKPSLQLPRHPTATPIISALAPVLPSRTTSAAISVTDSTCSRASDPNPLPEFIEHAYKFFVTNIFNPYPTRAEKETIVAQTNNERVTFSSISNWFTNARRRCGWTTILKERCEGNREQLVALATRVFVNPDPEDPVDPEIAKELMEMKEAVETMYQRKTRTSAWIEDLDNLEELLHPTCGPSTEKPCETAEDRRREREMQKKEREFERKKRKMQAEALRKAEKVTKMMQREQAKQNKEQRPVSSAAPKSPQQLPYEVEDTDVEPIPVAGGKRKLPTDDDVYRFPDPRQVSRSSSFTSDVSSEGRVPSLTWSDSGDERPYKRSRSSTSTPPSSSYSNSPRLSPGLEVPEGLRADHSALGTLFDSYETLISHGKKRLRDDAEHNSPTPQAKRRRGSQPIIASVGPDLELLPPPSPLRPSSASLFTPRASFDATSMQAPRKRSLQFPDLDAILGLDLTQPAPVQVVPPDPALPLDVGVFDWSSAAFGDAGADDVQVDLSRLLESIGNDEAQVNVPMDLPPFDLTSPTQFPQGQSRQADNHSAFPDDLTGLMSGLMSDEALHDMGMDFNASFSAPPMLSPIAPVATPLVSTQDTSPTPAELADKALKRERKRKELEEKRAALEREHARLAELERELEED